MLNHFKPVDGHNPLKIYSKNPLRLSLHHLQRPVMEANQRKSTGQILKSTVHPWKWTWNIIMEVWKIMFLPKWVICRFHVNLPGCKKNGPNHDLLSMNHLLERFPEQQKQTLLATFNITIKIYHNLSGSIYHYHLLFSHLMVFSSHRQHMHQASVTAPEPLRAGGNSELRLETPRNGRK